MHVFRFMKRLMDVEVELARLKLSNVSSPGVVAVVGDAAGAATAVAAGAGFSV